MIETTGKVAFLSQGSRKANLRHLTRECSVNMFIGSEPALDIFFSGTRNLEVYWPYC